MNSACSRSAQLDQGAIFIVGSGLGIEDLLWEDAVVG